MNSRTHFIKVPWLLLFFFFLIRFWTESNKSNRFIYRIFCKTEREKKLKIVPLGNFHSTSSRNERQCTLSKRERMFCVFFLRKERTDRPNAMILFIAKLKYIESDLKEANDLKQTENFRIAVGYRTLSTRFFFFFHLTQSRYSSFCYFKKNGAPMLIMKEKKNNFQPCLQCFVKQFRSFSRMGQQWSKFSLMKSVIGPLKTMKMINYLHQSRIESE